MTKEKADKVDVPTAFKSKRVNYHSPYDSGGMSSAFSRFLKYEKGEEEHATDWGDDSQEYGHFLFTKYVDPNDPDDIGKTPNWSSNTAGRIGVRLFSRGILGTTAFLLGGKQVARQMPGYLRVERLLDQRLKHWATGEEIALNTHYKMLTHAPLRYVARFYDKAFGEPLAWTFNKLGGSDKLTKFYSPALNKTVEWPWGQHMTVFRYRNPYNKLKPLETGRSLGYEAVAISADFAAGSAGDATGREFCDLLDPNFRNGQRDKDGNIIRPWKNENGTLNWGNIFNSMGRKTWKIFALNQGEDWAIAVPYVFQLRWQRAALGKVFPGFRYMADEALNWGWRVNKQNQVIGSYAVPNALDLQMRFTGYNWLTHMYRDLYHYVGDVQSDIKQHGLPTFQMPDEPGHALLDGVAETFRYGIKGGIKSVAYMTPSVPFFWMFRLPSSKPMARAFYVDDEFGITEAGRKRSGPLRINEHHEGGWKFWTGLRSKYHYLKGDPTKPTVMLEDEVFVKNSRGQVVTRLSKGGDLGKGFEYHHSKYNKTLFEKVLAPLGLAPEWAANEVHRFLTKTAPNMDPQNRREWRRFTRDWMNVSTSYTPYMIAKAEFTLLYGGNDNGVDQGADLIVDGLTSFNAGKMKRGGDQLLRGLFHPNESKHELMMERKAKMEQERQAKREALIQKKQEGEAVNDGAEDVKSATVGAEMDVASQQPKTRVRDVIEIVETKGKDKAKGENPVKDQKSVPPKEAAAEGKWEREMMERFMKDDRSPDTPVH